MRFVIRLVAIGLLLLVVLGVAAAFLLDRGARIAVEKGVSYALAVPTTAGSVSIRPLQGSVGLADLSIANPKGFSDQSFLKMDKAAMNVRLSSLMSDVVEVPSLELSGINLRLEGRGAKTNYAAILDNLKRLDTPADPNKQPDLNTQGSQKRFIVHDLTIRKVTIEADYALDSPLGNLASTKAAVSLPEIHLKDVGNGKSLTLAELSAQILQALLQAAASGNIPGLSGSVAKDLKSNLSGLEVKAKEIEKEVKDALKDLGKSPFVDDLHRLKQ